MSNDLTEQFPASEPRDTTPILERILAEVLASREGQARIETRLDRIESKVDGLRSELVQTRKVFREELSLEIASLHRRVDDVEQRSKEKEPA